MGKNNVCLIYDSDEQYAKRLMNIINDAADVPYNAKVFTRENELGRYMANNSADVLMVSEECYTYDLEKRHAGKVIVMCEDEHSAEGINNRKKEQLQGICKYQSSYQLLNSIIRQKSSVVSEKQGQAEIIGIYGFNPSMRVILALLASTAYAKKGRQLFINLDEFSGMDSILPAKETNLADAIYIFKQSGMKYVKSISDVICESGKLHYIPPVACAEDISYMDSKLLTAFIESICREEGYEYVVVNISEGMTHPWEFLAYSDYIYFADSGGYIENCRFQELKRYFMENGMEDIVQNIVRIHLRVEENIDADFMQRIEYTEAFKYVETLIEG